MIGHHRLPDPHLRVVRGMPDELELAALLLAVTLLARSGDAAHPARHRRSGRAHWDRPRLGGFHPCHSWRAGHPH
ncbi:acyl-CoA carboxylase epsilon subunit [Streptomyces sp. NRRL S-87]|uniref:acyl-CoA carboxylase epsilon subunit n=1 Tax=Streptomyces sp. NRRL S-87 TaxID=1463920 RepID=UPI0005666E4B|nr:acyl-CoA carboxylase epsilon subunit [Streptomyces sp. NRRL S-87]